MARVLRARGALVLQIHCLRYYLARALGARNWRALVHALRAIASGATFELTSWQPGEMFLRVEKLARLLAAAGIEMMEVSARDRAAPLVLGRRF